MCVNKCSDVKCSDVEWTDVIYVKRFCFEVKWSELKWSEVKWSGVTVKFLGTKVPCTLGWTYTEGTWMYCDYFIRCVSCTVVVLICFVMCGCVYVGVFWQSCACFGNMCTCVYCVLYCLYCVFCLVSFMYIYSYLFCLYWCKDYCHRVTTVCTGVRTTATEWQLNCS
jgi:hypothetical protein